jgi:hypothetical protein
MAGRIEANPESVVVRYREVIGRLEAATDAPNRFEWQEVARRMRQEWRLWQGEDSLHEMAFSETIE